MDLSLGPKISLEVPQAVLKLPLHRRQCKHSYQELQMFRAIDGPSLPPNLIECRPGLRPPMFYYGLELGSSYADFEDKVEIWSKDIGFFPSIKQVYGCSCGSGWIVNFGNSKQLPKSHIIDYFVEKLGVGQPKWFLSLEFPHWRWV